MSKKNWKRVAAGIWRNKSGTLYERPKVDGRWTYRSLETEDLETAKTKFHQRRAGVEEKPHPPPAQADQTKCDRYHTWRKARLVRGTGDPSWTWSSTR